LESIRYTDFTPEYLIEISFLVGVIARGSITMKDLIEMKYSDFRYMVARARELYKKNFGEDNG
jgi:hypothetical protein